MASVITLKGIDQAISNLNYRNKNSLKYRIVNNVRQFYENESSVESMQGINGDELIKVLWNTGGDPAIIKKKRKNLSSIKYFVNANLKELYREKKNPDGIIIGPTNIFVICNEAKDDALKAFKDSIKGKEAVSLGQITDILNIVNEILSNPEAIADAESVEGLRKFDQLKNLIQGLSEKVGLGGSKSADPASKASMAIPGEKETAGGPDLSEVSGGYEDLEEIEIDDAIEEVEVEGDLEEIEVTDDLSKTEVSGASGDKEAIEGPYESEAKKGDGGLKEIGGDGAGTVEKAGLIEKGGPKEGIGLKETGEAHAQAGQIVAEELFEEPEEIAIDDAIEEVEVEEELETVDLIEGSKETDFLAGDLGEKYSEGYYEGNDEIRKDRLLAENFNNLIGTIDRYYNQYILIPEGEYIVGSKRPKKDEKPEQLVHLSPFYIGKFQVTNALFEIFIEKTGYRTTAERIGYGTVYYGRLQKTVDEKTGLKRFTWNAAIMSKTIEGACWYQPLGRGSTIHNKRNHPVVQVSLEDAIAFAAWTGKSLPTEDEWETASRTAKGYVFPWGNERNKDACNIEESYVGDTTPVDKYIKFASDFGIVDATGNVLEWTLDRSEPLSSEKDRSKYFVVKGGSWISGNELRLFSRFKFKREAQSNILGFRCVAY